MEKRILQDIADGEGNMFKILNGEQAKPGEFQFIVSLEFIKQHFCGGSVMSKYWVLSAAHCFPYHGMASVVRARVGTTKQGSGGSLHGVKEIITHPGYEHATFNNDIALLKVKEPFILGGDVQTVKLARYGNFLKDGADVVSAGWGITTKTGYRGTSPFLMKAELQIVNHKMCNNMFGIQRLREFFQANLKVTNHMICAWSPFGKDTTKGDSGGPLLYREGDEFVLVGVVSWGDGRGDPDSPGVYTDVTKYYKWIYFYTLSNDW